MTPLIQEFTINECNGIKNFFGLLKKNHFFAIHLRKIILETLFKTFNSQPLLAIPGVVKSLAPSSTVMRPI